MPGRKTPVFGNNLNGRTRKQIVSQDMTETELKREKALQDAKMYMANDWELKEETPEYFLLTRSKATFLKHFIIFIFTWWSAGIINLIYHYTAKEKKKIIK